LQIFGRDEGEPPPGDLIQTRVSDGSGFFNLYILKPWVRDIMRLEVQVPAGFVVSAIETETGVVVDDNAIEWAQPEQRVHWNMIYMDWPTPTPTPTPSPALEGFTWQDMNANGLHDEAEPHLSGIELTLMEQNAPPGQQRTWSVISDESGYYRFDEIPDGAYALYVSITAGDYLPTTASMVPIDTRAAQASIRVDFGLYPVGETPLFLPLALRKHNINANPGLSQAPFYLPLPLHQ